MSSYDSDPGTDEEEFWVAKILERRLDKNGDLQYLVKWRGFRNGDSWEPLKNLSPAPVWHEKIEEFEKSWAARVEKEMGMRTGAAEKRMKINVESEEPVAGPSVAVAGGNELHPLLNPVILANFFSVCSHELLSKARLVCKSWYRDSLIPWGASSTIGLRCSKDKKLIYVVTKEYANPKQYEYDSDSESDDEDNGNKNPNVKAPPIPLSEFLDDTCDQDGKVTPYRQFHLEQWSFGWNSQLVKEQQDRFWNVMGKNVTLLKLSNCSFDDAGEFRKAIFQTCPNLSDLILDKCYSFSSQGWAEEVPTQYAEPICGEKFMLKSLSIDKAKVVEGNTDDIPGVIVIWSPRGIKLKHPLPVSYLELLSHFPSLTTLNIFLDYYMDVDHLLLLNTIKVIRRHDKRKLPLKRLHFGPGGFTLTAGIERAKVHEIFSRFQELKLNLEYLVIDLSSKLDTLKDLLLSTGGSIRKIKAGLGPAGSGEISGRHRFPRNPEFPCCNFPFGVELPNLQTMIISDTVCKDLEFLQWMPNLVKLRISHIGDPTRECDSNRTTIVSNTSETRMGNVKLLKLKELFLGYDVLQEDVKKLCKWMPNVEILSMVLDDDQFSSVCGGWRNLTHLHQLGGTDLHDKGVTGMGWEEGGENIRPNIPMLKNLYCFRYAKPTCKLTDLSVYNGFLKLSNLQILDISSYDEHITDNAVKELHEKFPHCQVRSTTFRGGREDKNGFRGIECEYFQ